jgi:DNA-binding LacI/PurR family transcriptional regulator
LPHFTQPSFVERLKGIDAVLGPSHYDMAVANVEDVAGRDRVLAQLARSERVDGVIVITLVPTASQLRAFRDAGIPVVLVDAYHTDLPSVYEDSVAGAHLATRHLIELGHERIAFLSDPFEDLFSGRSRGYVRYKGHCDALQAAGLKADERLLRIGANYRKDAFVMASELLRLPEPPTAIFAFSDVHAIGALQAARSLGLHVPGDISIMGYDDIDMAEAVGLTTVRQSLIESGRMGAELLLKELEGATPGAPAHVNLGVELVARSSTGQASAIGNRRKDARAGFKK